MDGYRSVGFDGLLGRQARLDQRRDGLFDLLEGTVQRACAVVSANEDQVAQDGVVKKLLAHRPRVIAQRRTPIGCVDTGHCELVSL